MMSIFIPLGSIVFSAVIAIFAFIKNRTLQKEAFNNSMFSFIIKERNILYRDFAKWFSETAQSILQEEHSSQNCDILFVMVYKLAEFEIRFKSLNLSTTAKLIFELIGKITTNLDGIVNYKVSIIEFTRTTLTEYFPKIEKSISMESLLKDSYLKILHIPMNTNE